MSAFDKTPRTSAWPSVFSSPSPRAGAAALLSSPPPTSLLDVERSIASASADDEAGQSSSAKLPLLNVQLPSSSTTSDGKSDHQASAERKASRPSARPPRAAPASPASRRASRLRSWIASGNCSGLFLNIAILVAIVYMITLMGMDRSTAHNSYTSLFASDTSAMLSTWDCVVIIVVTITAWVTCGLFDLASDRAKRKSAFIAFGVYVLLLVSGNVIDLSDVAAHRASESAFAARFNAIYCDVRTLRVCLEEDPKALLGLTGVNATAASPSASSPDKDQAPSAECPMLMARAVSPILISGSSNAKLRAAHMVNGEDVLKTDGKTLNAFLDDCASSVQVDKWCATMYARKSPMSDTEQLALPSPFASNPSVFAAYVSDRASYMFVSNVMLGAIALCFLLAGVGYALAAKYQL